MVFQLIYQSDALPGSDGSEDIEILRQSLEYNSANNITGFLVRTGNRFCQHLEGSQRAVLKLFEKIWRDPRHRNIALLGSWDADTRVFNNWSMGYRRFADMLSMINQTSPEPSQTHAQLLSGILLQLSHLPASAVLPDGLRETKRL